MSTMNELVGDALRIAEDYAARVAACEGEPDEATLREFAALLGQTDAQFKEKVDAYVAVIRQYEAMETAAREESRRLAERAKSHAGHVSRLKDTLAWAMTELRIDKAKTALNTVSLAENPSIPYDADMEKVPQTYKRIKVELDKTAIQTALKAGLVIEGVTTKEKTKSLRIR